jgi:hypothetical protein
MKIANLVSLSAVAAVVLSVSSGFAAPSESVESAGASTAYQKVDAMLSEQIVADQLQAVGLTCQQAHARLSQLTDQQLGQLAAQADLIQAGGTIQGCECNDVGPLACLWQQVTAFVVNVYRVVVCWRNAL